MVIEPEEDGENWSFRWYADPISNGLSKWVQCNARVSEGYIELYGMTMPRDEEEVVEMGRALQFVKARFRTIGLEAEQGL
jgi:hypothetical protein